MFDEGDGTDSGERAPPPESPPPPLPVCLPRGSPPSPRPLDLFSAASPLLGDTDPPYPATPECLHPSPESRETGDSPHSTPAKLCPSIGEGGSPFLSRQDVSMDAVFDRCDDLFPKWRGRGAATSDRLQHRGQRIPRAPQGLDLGNHSVEPADTEFDSETRQT